MTFVLKVSLGKKIIYTKWVFAIRRDSNKFIYKYKTHLKEVSIKNEVLMSK